MAEGVPARLSRSEARRFGLLVGTAFLALGAILAWRGRPWPAVSCGATGAALIVLGVILPERLRPMYRVWMGMAGAISKVTTPIFMGVVYFGVLTPIGLLRRLAGAHPLRARVEDDTLWVPRQTKDNGPESLEHQF